MNEDKIKALEERIKSLEEMVEVLSDTSREHTSILKDALKLNRSMLGKVTTLEKMLADDEDENKVVIDNTKGLFV